MNLHRAVIDTNIIVSGLLFGGIPLKIIRTGISRKFIWVISPVLVDEAQKVLQSKKFGLKSQEIDALLTPILRAAEFIVPSVEIDLIKRCPGDNRVLECAVEGRCSHIVTGDRKDLLKLGSFKNIKIIAAREFLKMN